MEFDQRQLKRLRKEVLVEKARDLGLEVCSMELSPRFFVQNYSFSFAGTVLLLLAVLKDEMCHRSSAQGLKS